MASAAKAQYYTSHPNGNKEMSDDNTTFHVRRTEHNMPLVEFLAGRMKTSGRKAKALLDTRAVVVEGRRVWMARHKLCEGDTVIVVSTDTPPLPRGLRIIHRDGSLAVVDKPSGILSNGPDSVETLFRTQYSVPEALVAHRLDRDTSGCLIVALSKEVFDGIVRLFRDGRVEKRYHVIAAGNLYPPDQIINRPIDGQRAVTHIKTLSSNKKACHLLARIETGRTHQIRKHLTAAGHPVVGDRTYSHPASQGPVALAAPRQMLHAESITFPHPTDGSVVRATSPIPDDFKRCLKQLRLE